MSDKKFDLGLKEQSVTLIMNSGKRTHVFRSPEPDEAKEYLKRIKSKQRTQDFKTFMPESDTTDADLWVWDQLIIRVEGYVSRTLGNISEREDWKSRIQAMDRQVFGQSLFILGVVPKEPLTPEAIIFYDEEIIVDLSAVQNNVAIKPLRHHFRFPQTSELKEWNRAKSRGRVELTRTGTVIHRDSLIDAQTGTYNAMVIGIEGYSYDGREIKSAEDAVAMMNPIHKQYAIVAAFEQLGGEDNLQLPLAETPSEKESGKF